MANERFLGEVEQGIAEEIPYTITTTLWGASPSAFTVTAKQAGNDVTSTVIPSGSATVSGNVITLPVIKSLTADLQYRIDTKFTTGGAKFVAWFLINAEA